MRISFCWNQNTLDFSLLGKHFPYDEIENKRVKTCLNDTDILLKLNDDLEMNKVNL